MPHITILGIDPGTREMGTAVIRGPKLLAAGVHTLRNGSRPYDTVGLARRIVLEQIKDFAPKLVAIEKPLLLPTKRAALVSVIGQELHERSAELGCQVVEMDAREVRNALAGDAKLNKLQVAHLLAERYFPQLAPKVPKPPARAALGFAPKDRYWLHMFDAIAVAVASARSVGEAGREQGREAYGEQGR